MSTQEERTKEYYDYANLVTTLLEIIRNQDRFLDVLHLAIDINKLEEKYQDWEKPPIFFRHYNGIDGPLTYTVDGAYPSKRFDIKKSYSFKERKIFREALAKKEKTDVYLENKIDLMWSVFIMETEMLKAWQNVHKENWRPEVPFFIRRYDDFGLPTSHVIHPKANIADLALGNFK